MEWKEVEMIIPADSIEFKEIVADTDNVNHPKHYETGKYECIDVMLETQGAEAVSGFCIGNAFKYLYRHKNKNGVEDVEKAVWYLNKYLEIEKGGEETGADH